MFRLKLFILFLSYRISYAHECFTFGTNCIFSAVETNKSDLYFHPSSTNNTAIKNVMFKNSSIPVFTDELCKTFPNLRILEMDNVALEEIAPNALHECKNLVYLSFYQNKLKQMDVNTFEMNHELEQLILQHNLLKSFEGNTVEPLKNLRLLSVSDNYLTELRFDHFPTLQNLTELDIYGNNLRDIPVFDMLYKFPRLTSIYMHNNLFDCDRLRVILRALHNRYVQIKEWEKEKSTRNTGLHTIENVECVLSLKTDVVPVQVNPRQEKEEEKNYTIYILIGAIALLVFAAIAGTVNRSRGYSQPTRRTRSRTVSVCCCCDCDSD